MKTFLVVVLLAALGLTAEANLEHLKPRDAVMPVNPKYNAQEWQEIYSGQKLSPEYSPNFKQEYGGNVDVLLDEKHQRITNGILAAPCQFSWQAALIVDNAFFCGGSLISQQWVLTATLCTGNSYQIILGSNQWNLPGSGSLVLSSTTTIVHEQYNPHTLNNDIALIQLPSDIKFTPCIYPTRLRYIEDGLDGATVRFSGWGRTSDNSITISMDLKYADLTVIPNTACAYVYGNIVTCSKICTDSTGGVSTCGGDIGGPLVYLESDGYYTQVGVSTFIASAGCEVGYPAGFTRVNRYLCWIASHTDLTFSFCP